MNLEGQNNLLVSCWEEGNGLTPRKRAEETVNLFYPENQQWLLTNLELVGHLLLDQGDP